MKNLIADLNLTVADKRRIAVEFTALALIVAFLLTAFGVFGLMMNTEVPKPPVLAGEVTK